MIKVETAILWGYFAMMLVIALLFVIALLAIVILFLNLHIKKLYMQLEKKEQPNENERKELKEKTEY